ncbi:ArsA family ATPase [Streptomyces sp. MAR4 CNX-425]|uniref:ArsA family ATPase n=1 Tax=Streptomyces sp. MAR4 CNX-425 TaxID=3406343 RepID=UPI003B50636D
MRTILVTGAAGAGRTTVAAATALRAGRDGARVLLLSADAEAGGLLATVPEALIPAPRAGAGTAPEPDPDGGAERAGEQWAEEPPPWTEPVRIEDGVWAARLRGAESAAEALAVWQERYADALEQLGATPLAAEELTPLPGSREFALLRALVTLYETPGGGGSGAVGPWDLVVVDMPAARETLRVLALPEQLVRYLHRLLPAERQAARGLRPMLGRLLGAPVPAGRVYEAAAHWEHRLQAVREAAEAAGTGMRLVLEATPRGARELRRLRAALALQGCAVETVVANRVLPAGSEDAWYATLADEQHRVVKELGAEVRAAGGALCALPHLGPEPQGPVALGTLAEAVDPPRAAVRAPGTSPGDPAAVDDLLAAEGVLRYRLPLPGAERADLTLVRRGDELLVTVAGHRRALPLPSALRRCTIDRAGLHDGELQIRFAPDPAVWPR